MAGVMPTVGHTDACKYENTRTIAASSFDAMARCGGAASLWSPLSIDSFNSASTLIAACRETCSPFCGTVG